MELNGNLLIGAPRETVWRALNDPQVLVNCIPGCEDVQQVSPTETHTRVLLKMGPVRARFVGKILMSEVRINEGCVLKFEGSGGAAGFARGTSAVGLASEGEATRLTYTASANVGGKLGQIGGRMIDASAKQMADQFFTAFQAHVGQGAPVTQIESGQDNEPTVTAATAGGPDNAPAPAPLQAPSRTAPAAYHPAGASVASATAAPTIRGEGVRALWFFLGAASTGFGVWLASRLIN